MVLTAVLLLLAPAAASAADGETLLYTDRADIPEAYRWNLADIFPTPADFDLAYAKIDALIPQVAAFEGRLGESPETLAAALDLQSSVASAVEDLFVYASQWQNTDTRDAAANAAQQRAQALAARFTEATSWVEPEIAQLPADTLATFRTHPAVSDYDHLIDDILRTREHIRSQEVEEVLAGASLLRTSPSSTYSALANADLEWPTITDADGEQVTATASLFYTFMASPDRRVRRDAAAAIFGTYDSYRNTFASTLAASIQKDLWLTRVRGYDSTLEASLDAVNVPRAVPDTLVETVRANVDAIHDYVGLRKEVLGLADFHLYDLYVNLVPDSDRQYTFDEGWALATAFWQETFGPEYAAVAKRARDERWIDVYSNTGKRGGAYSWGTYNTHPYLFLNWGGTLGDVFTLVHEMGHSIHSYLANSNNPYHDADYSLFVAEVASVASESLFFQWMLDRTDDPTARLAMLHHRMNNITGTFLRQIFFHEFEAAAHAAAAKGEPLTAETFGTIWGDLWTTYYGEGATLDDWYTAGWARIPHFYRTFYVWVYASSFAAGEAIAERVRSGDEGAVQDYLDALELGGSVYPMEVLKTAGVDMTDPEVIRTVMDSYRDIVAEMERLMVTKE